MQNNMLNHGHILACPQKGMGFP